MKKVNQVHIDTINKDIIEIENVKNNVKEYALEIAKMYAKRNDGFLDDRTCRDLDTLQEAYEKLYIHMGIDENLRAYKTLIDHISAATLIQYLMRKESGIKYPL